MCIGALLLCVGLASAASAYNFYCGTGVVTYASLNKYTSTKSIAETDFVPLNGYQSYRAYVYMSAKNSDGVILQKSEKYGSGYGTSDKPDLAILVLDQPGAYKWVSTHRSEKTSEYDELYIYN